MNLIHRLRQGSRVRGGWTLVLQGEVRHHQEIETTANNVTAHVYLGVGCGLLLAVSAVLTTGIPVIKRIPLTL